MKGRNMKVKEKMAVKQAAPRLNVENWLILKKYPDCFILKNRNSGKEKTIKLGGC